jgi:hypothetical protein
MPEIVLRAVLVGHRDGFEFQTVQLGLELALVLEALEPPSLLPARALLHPCLGVAVAREEGHTLVVDEVGDELH